MSDDEELLVQITFTDNSKSNHYYIRRSLVNQMIIDFNKVLKGISFGTGEYEAKTKNGDSFILALRFTEVRMIAS